MTDEYVIRIEEVDVHTKVRRSYYVRDELDNGRLAVMPLRAAQHFVASVVSDFRCRYRRHAVAIRADQAEHLPQSGLD